MQKTPLPTVQEIEQLTAFLPRLYAQGFSPVRSWGGGPMEDGTLSLPYPDYDPLVEEFFRVAASECWLDRDYSPGLALQMLRDEKVVRAASLPEIKTMLTFCLRGERFSDGHWAEMIEAGHIRRLLERLLEIRSEMLPP